MPDVTKEKIKRVLAKHGINNLEDLVTSLANDSEESPIGTLAKPDEGQNGKSWVIKLIRIDKTLDKLNAQDLPEALGE